MNFLFKTRNSPCEKKKIRVTNSFVTNCFHEFFVKRVRDTVYWKNEKFSQNHTVEITEIYCHRKKFRQINNLVISLVKFHGCGIQDTSTSISIAINAQFDL